MRIRTGLVVAGTTLGTLSLMGCYGSYTYSPACDTVVTAYVPPPGVVYAAPPPVVYVAPPPPRHVHHFHGHHHQHRHRPHW